MVVSIADMTFSFDTHSPRTERLFSSFLCEETADTVKLHITEQDRAEAERMHTESTDSAVLEWVACQRVLADVLPSYHRIFLHSVALSVNGNAFLLAGNCGIGKSTQLIHMMKQFPDAVTVINGDKPILGFHEGGVTVYPTPWNGKENLSGDRAFPLCGIVCLTQKPYDRISELSVRDALLPLFLQLFCTERSADAYRRQLPYLERLLTGFPLIGYENTGTEASAAKLYRYLLKMTERGDDTV